MFLVLAPHGDTYTETIMSGQGLTFVNHRESERVRADCCDARSDVQLCAARKPAMQEVGATT
jgi:hypothetical protein